MATISGKVKNLNRRHDIRYDAGEFGRQAAMAAQLIDAGIDAPVLKIKLDGFDTHENQIWRHPNLLRDLGRGLAGLRQSLIRSGHWDNTLIMTYSEFGRRALENESEGTDHGTASTLFLAGGAVHGGRVEGKWPGLEKEKLFEGRDLASTSDTREWIAAVLKQHWHLSNFDISNVFPDINPINKRLIKV